MTVSCPCMSFRELTQRIRVSAGFLIAPLLLISARPTPRSLAAGAAVALVGLAVRAWASGYLKKNKELTVTGPYAHTRNPLYLGTFFMGTGVAMGGGTLWFIIFFIVLYFLIYAPVMAAEAEYLGHLFPAEYEAYSRKVPIFVPRVTPYREDEARGQAGAGFQLAQYLRHREYRAALGVALVYALLVAKYLLINS